MEALWKEPKRIDGFPHPLYHGFEPGVTTLKAGHVRDPKRGTRALPADLIWHRDVAVKNRAGLTLYIDVFLPAEQKGPLPALVSWSPYGKSGNGFLCLDIVPGRVGIPVSRLSGYEKWEAPDPAEWCPRGYAIVNPDSRGTWDCEGNCGYLDKNEAEDGYDVIEFLAEQSWCNGNVSLTGNSWLAMAQYYIAQEKPPHLKCIAPWEGAGDQYREMLMRGGIPQTDFMEFVLSAFPGKGKLEDVRAEGAKWPSFNEFWETKRARMEDIEIPMYVLASYSTRIHTEGSLRAYREAKSPKKWLRIHATQEWHDIYQKSSNDDLQRFMDFYLKGIDNGWESTPRVRTSLLRFNAPPISERPETEFPIPRTVYKPFYLDAGSHTLSEKMPATANKVSYPSADFSSIASFSITFDQPTEINGHAKIKLWHSHDTGSDAEVYAILRKVDKEGKALRNSNIPLEDTPEVKSVDDLEDINTLVYHGPSAILRLSYRATDPSRALSPGEVFHPFDKPEPVAAGEVIEFEMGFWATGIAFEAGESLRVDIAGFDLRPPEFEPLRGFLKSDINEGTHTLYTGPDHPAVLTLPIV